MTCLHCGKPIGTDDGHRGWHRRCIRNFFGVRQFPEIDLTTRSLEELARRSVSTGVTVAGVQRKLSIHLSHVDGTDRMTLVGYPAGFILKPPSPDYPHLPEIEHLTMSLADAVGITTVPHALVELADGALAYITRRIDRRPEPPHRVPMEDLCQISERLTEDKYRGSYEQIAKHVARHSGRPGIDLSELFLVVVFSFVTGNADMHLKNVSLYRPGDEWILAPAYDLLSTVLVLPDDPEETALTLNGKKRRLNRSDFVAFGATAGLNPKAIDGLIRSIVRREPHLLAAVDEAILPGDLKHRFREVIAERTALLR